MARAAPAACSFWAMPQAMERLLASPKTTAVLPARSIIAFCFLRVRCGDVDGQPFLRISAVSGASAAQVDQFDFTHRTLEKARSEAPEFIYGIGGETANGRRARRRILSVLP